MKKIYLILVLAFACVELRAMEEEGAWIVEFFNTIEYRGLDVALEEAWGTALTELNSQWNPEWRSHAEISRSVYAIRPGQPRVPRAELQAHATQEREARQLDSYDRIHAAFQNISRLIIRDNWGLPEDQAARMTLIKQGLAHLIFSHITHQVLAKELLQTLFGASRYMEAAKGYFLRYNEDLDYADFKGTDRSFTCSIQDLIDAQAIIIRGNGYYDLTGKAISSWEGIDHIPAPENIVTLDLSSNYLTSEPTREQLERFVNLKTLRLNNNELKQIGAAFAHQHLTTLDVSHNALGDIDNALLGNLPACTHIDFSNNELSRFSFFGCSQHLREVDLRENVCIGITEISTIPQGLLLKYSFYYEDDDGYAVAIQSQDEQVGWNGREFSPMLYNHLRQNAAIDFGSPSRQFGGDDSDNPDEDIRDEHSLSRYLFEHRDDQNGCGND